MATPRSHATRRFWIAGAAATAALAGIAVALTTSQRSHDAHPGATGESTAVSRAATTPPSSASVPATGAIHPISPAPSARSTTVAAHDGRTYDLDIWAQDHLTDCAAHAYGQPMIAYLTAHPCDYAIRVLATIDVNGRDAVVSTVTIVFPASPEYVTNTRFARLERTDGTGGINDLLRDGHPIPGIATAIPASEVFTVDGQDSGSTIFDLWWVTGPTSERDPTLLALAHALFLTPFTTGY